MRIVITGLIVMVLPLAADTGRAGEPAPKASPAPLQGTWKLTGLETDGKESEMPEVQVWWVIKGTKVHYGGQELARVTTDETTRPRCIDLAFRTPERTLEGIYSVEADTLKICVNRLAEGVKERPSGFSTRDKPEWRLLVFQRDKDRKIDDVTGLGGFVGLTIQMDMETKRLVITGIQKDSPAMKAGLKKDDVLIQVGKSDAKELRDVVKRIRQAKPGSELELRIKRGEKEQGVTVKVGVVPFFMLD